MRQPIPTIVDVPGISVGSAENAFAATGCTVLLFSTRAICGVDIRGGSTGTREFALLDPTASMDAIDGIVLTGGSAFGLDAASGVAEFLEKRGSGFTVGRWRVPIVPAAVLFDLDIGNGSIRPDRAMGFAAAANAGLAPFRAGNYGAGCGATVGKLGGMANSMKGGLGSASRILSNGVAVGALVVVNALGDIRDPASGAILAGRRDGASSEKSIVPSDMNTTLAVIGTNAKFNKAQATAIARMAHDGFARVIVPSHTTRDGDVIFAVSTGELDADIDTIGILSAELVIEAIVQAVLSARTVGNAIAHVDACRGDCRYAPHER